MNAFRVSTAGAIVMVGGKRGMLGRRYTVGIIGVLASCLMSGAAQAAAPPCNDFAGKYTYQLNSAKSFSADAYDGAADDPGNLAGALPQSILRVGVFTIKQNCSVSSGRAINTNDTDTGATRSIDLDFTGTITPNLDGTGAVVITFGITNACSDMTVDPPSSAGLCDFSGVKERYAVVFNKMLKTVDMIQTNNVGGGAKSFLTGVAQRREP